MSDTTKNPPEPEMYSRDYVQTLRDETRTWKAKAEEHGEAARRAREDASGARDRVIRAELRAAATAAGMIDLDGLKLADTGSVTLDDAGAVQGADTLLADLRERKPYLFGAAGTAHNTSSNPGAAPTPARNSPRHAKDMSKEEFERELNKLIRR